MLKITEIKMKDKNAHHSDLEPEYECDIVLKYNPRDGECHTNQIEVKSLKFSKVLLNHIAETLLIEFKSKMAE